MLTIHLCGGLGNQLFQLAAGEHIARQTKRDFYLQSNTTPVTHHSSDNYFDSIFRSWKSCPVIHQPHTAVNERTPYRVEDWNARIRDPVVCLNGYFQNYKNIPDDFCERLAFDTSVLAKYEQHRTSAFLHIRGGDYVEHWFHDVGLDAYYQQAIREFPEGTHFYVFTNDRPYASTKRFLKSVPHTFVNESEVDSLYIMSQCGLGGICANSTFSWWGAYLNPKRHIVMPTRWFNQPTIDIEGYYFDGVKQINA